MPTSAQLSARLAIALLVLAAVAGPASAQLNGSCLDNAILATHTLSTIGLAQRHVEAGLLDGDLVPDLVISSQTSVIISLGTLNAGQVTYQVRASYPTSLDPTGSAIADFDGDGINDLAVALDGGGGVLLFRGQGTGGLGTGQFSQYLQLQVGSAWDLAVADLNGDGFKDLVIGLRAGPVLTYLGTGSAGQPDGNFIAAGSVASGGSCKGLELADMNGDGILDVVVAGENTVTSVLQGNGSGGTGDGTFTLAHTLSSPGSSVFDVTVGDFNRDGVPDIATANYLANSFSVYLGGPSFTYRSPVVHATPGSPLGIASGDFDGDGYEDLAVAAAGSGGSFSYFRNTTVTGPLTDGFAGHTLYGPARISYNITAVDLNRDGTLDVLVPSVTDLSILAAFNSCQPSRPRTLTIQVVGTGEVAREPDLPEYEIGSEVLLTAIAGTGWVFSHWLLDLTGSTNPATIVMSVDRTVTAVFIPEQQTLTITLDGDGQGSVVRVPARATYDLGATVELTAVPAFGSLFGGWSGDASGTDNPIALIMDDDKSVTARFDPDPTLSPAILSVADVPLDQGGRVKLRWTASSLESPATAPQHLVTQYYVWREVPEAAFRAAEASAAASGRFRRTTFATREYFWEFVVALPASRFAGYSYTAGTTSDSSRHGNPFTAFLVQARNAAANQWWDSAPDSGYSVDNLSPPTPGPLAGEFGATANRFKWGTSHAPDLHAYRMHRGTSRDFLPDDGNLIGEPRDTLFTDPEPLRHFYKLAAVDIHGNLSHYVVVSPDAPVSALASLVAAEGRADRIRLEWNLSQAGLAATVHRRTLDSDWRAVAFASADGRGSLEYEDVDVQRGQRYRYRLGIMDGGEETFFAEVEVLAEELRFALEGVAPNPGPGDRLVVRFVLPGTARATLELLDVAGRRLAVREVSGQAGRHSVVLAAPQRFRAGLYWVRLRHGGLERSIRAVVVE